MCTSKRFPTAVNIIYLHLWVCEDVCLLLCGWHFPGNFVFLSERELMHFLFSFDSFLTFDSMDSAFPSPTEIKFH